MEYQYNYEESLLLCLDGEQQQIPFKQILDEGSKTGYVLLSLPGQSQVAVLALTHTDGTCGLNDRGGSTSLSDEQESSYTFLSEGIICWYKQSESEEKYHACPRCCSMEYVLYDTSVRLPEFVSCSTWT